MGPFPPGPIYVCGPSRTYGEYDAGALTSQDMAMSVVLREGALPLGYARAGGTAAVRVARERVGAQGRGRPEARQAEVQEVGRTHGGEGLPVGRRVHGDAVARVRRWAPSRARDATAARGRPHGAWRRGSGGRSPDRQAPPCSMASKAAPFPGPLSSRSQSK